MKQKMPIVGILILFTVLLISGCSFHTDTSHILEHYQKHHDYASLKTLAHYLKAGMTQTQVEKIVGKPDYSPAPGTYYYGSNSGCLGLILIYHRVGDGGDPSKVKITTLDQIILGEIRE